jgi:hypothetical protein
MSRQKRLDMAPKTDGFLALKIYLKWVIHFRKNIRPSLNIPSKKSQLGHHWSLQNKYGSIET